VSSIISFDFQQISAKSIFKIPSLAFWAVIFSAINSFTLAIPFSIQKPRKARTRYL